MIRSSYVIRNTNKAHPLTMRFRIRFRLPTRSIGYQEKVLNVPYALLSPVQRLDNYLTDSGKGSF
jgi:hypothetical protein